MRSIYTFLDMLGDIGGLFDALCYLSSMFIFTFSLFLNFGPDSFIVGSIFKTESKKEVNQVKRIKRRRPMKIRLCSLMYLCDSKSERMYNRAVERF